MDYKRIDAGMKPLFQSLAETGITLDGEKLFNIIRGFQKRLVERKQGINREVGFTVNLHSDDHWNQVVLRLREKESNGKLESQDLLSQVIRQLMEARALSSLIRKLQQVYDMANNNFRILDRKFGLYPKYGLDLNGKITTIGELSIDDLPEEVLGVIHCQDKTLIRATYSYIISAVVQKLSDDLQIDVESFIHGLAKSQNIVSSFFGRTAIVPETESERSRFVVAFPVESTAMDIAKLGFIGLFEDYRLGKLRSQIFAIAPYSVYLFAPDEHAELISSVCRECLESAHTDFALSVDITTGSSLDRLK